MTTKPASAPLRVDLQAAETVPLDGLTKEQLNELIHTLIAKRIVGSLRNLEFGCTPQMIAQARAFLNDQGITGLDLPGTPTEAVKEAFKDKLPFKLAQ